MLIGIGLGALFLAIRDRERIFAGVRAGSVQLGGLELDAAAERLRAELPAASGRLQLVDPANGRRWTVDPLAYGAALDATSLATAAWLVGRQGALPAQWLTRLRVRLRGYDILAYGRAFDAEQATAALEDLAPDVDTPPRDAALWLEQGELQVQPRELGHQLDIAGSRERLARWTTNPVSDTVELAIIWTSPRVYDLSSVALAYRQIVSGPVHLIWREGISRTLTADQLKSLVTIQPVPNTEGGTSTGIVFDTPKLARWVATLSSRIERPPRDARFEFDPAVGVKIVSPARTGLQLDVAGTVQRLIEASYTAERTTTPEVLIVQPQVPDELIESLTDLEELSRSYISLKGVSGGMLINAYRAVEQIHGVAWPVGDSLSLNGILGEVSAAKGYDMVAIEGAQRISRSAAERLDGGISHVATALFRAAVWAGLPVLERHASPYRIGWLEPPVGLDAAVDGRRLDLQLGNDTGGPLLIQASIDNQRQAVVVVLFGRLDGRRVRLEGPTVSDLTPARPPVVVVDDRVERGQQRQVGWAREGAVATVRRYVRRADGGETEDTWQSYYEPAADVYVRGP